jgi:hypothetical protein
LRRQADIFMELVDLQGKIGRAQAPHREDRDPSPQADYD